MSQSPNQADHHRSSLPAGSTPARRRANDHWSPQLAGSWAPQSITIKSLKKKTPRKRILLQKSSNSKIVEPSRRASSSEALTWQSRTTTPCTLKLLMEPVANSINPSTPLATEAKTMAAPPSTPGTPQWIQLVSRWWWGSRSLWSLL